MEATALKELIKVRYPSTAMHLSLPKRGQDLTMRVPEGWLVFILIEKLSGLLACNFWSATMGRPAITTLSQRNKLRAAFKEALS